MIEQFLNRRCVSEEDYKKIGIVEINRIVEAEGLMIRLRMFMFLKENQRCKNI